ncbi:MAG: hypothetical protein CDV28_12812 [Candidatus Electronema aureum]|uniref:Uncharacterized protein n=1 Tax=Candidatus Electronema aureum TaxID=2005002 RepID=A0A521G031_9BACT|nr:MAG: hypothetical protein CDV28_12812 [Candidatus Electronema aureum]
MKLKNTIIAGFVGAVGLLSLTAGNSFAYPYCSNGTLVEVGAGASGGTASLADTQYRYVRVRCNVAYSDGTAADASTASRYALLYTGLIPGVVNGAPASVVGGVNYDTDGKYATALTAAAMTGEKVTYVLSKIDPGAALLLSLGLAPTTP